MLLLGPEVNPGTHEVGLKMCAREHPSILIPAFSHPCPFLPSLQVLAFPVVFVMVMDICKEECSQEWMGGPQNEETEALYQATLPLPWASGKAQPSPGIPSGPQFCLWEGHSRTKFLKTKPVSLSYPAHSI